MVGTICKQAKTHKEIKDAFLGSQKDADQTYQGWKEKLGRAGESSVQAESFNVNAYESPAKARDV